MPREINDEPRVFGRPYASMYDKRIAGFLLLEVDIGMGDPYERYEPEERTDRPRDELCEIVFALNMGELMHQDSADFRFRPPPGIKGKHNSWFQDLEGEGYSAPWASHTHYLVVYPHGFR